MSLTAVPTAVEGRRVWRCDDCGKHGVWEDGWKWLGQLEDRKLGGPIVDRVLCPDCPMDPDYPVLPG